MIVDDRGGELRRECRVLELACAWADLYDQTALGMEYAPLVERACMVGGPPASNSMRRSAGSSA